MYYVVVTFVCVWQNARLFMSFIDESMGFVVYVVIEFIGYKHIVLIL